MMKYNIRQILCVIVSIACLVSCEDTTLKSPKADFNIDKSDLNVNESMMIEFKGEAESVVVFTGDDKHIYDSLSVSHTGFIVNKGRFSYAYEKPGRYQVVCVASNYDVGAVNLLRDTSSIWVTVIDDQTEIERISCPQILYDEVFAQKCDNDEWLMNLPRKVKFKTAQITTKLEQRLDIYMSSLTSQIDVDSVAYNEKTKYDLAQPLDIKVTSDFGTERSYQLFTQYIPEFKTLKVNGVAAKLLRSEYDYTAFEMHVTLPASTDLSALSMEFTNYTEHDEVWIGDAPLSSGATVNANSDVEFVLKSHIEGREDLAIESRTKLLITTE